VSSQRQQGRGQSSSDRSSFEVFKPPYLFRGPRPVISKAPAGLTYGRTTVITMATAKQAANIDSVNLVRNSAITHIVDADQRTIQLRVISHRGRRPTATSHPPAPTCSSSTP